MRCSWSAGEASPSEGGSARRKHELHGNFAAKPGPDEGERAQLRAKERSMRRSILIVVGALSLTLVPGSWAAVHADRTCGDVRMPGRIDSLGEALSLQGMGIRRATFLNVHVYVAGLYLAQPTRAERDILQPARSKAMVLHFVRDVDRKDMLSAMHDGLRDNAGSDLGAATAHMKNLERYLPNLREGVELRFAYRPTQGLHVFADSKLIGVEKDDTYANLLFKIWLGPKPPDADLKRGLLGGRCD